MNKYTRLCLLVLLLHIATACPEDKTSLPLPSPTPSPVPSKDQCSLPQTCQDWYNLGIRKSCHYPIYSSNGTNRSTTPKLVYCDMKGINCDGIGGWTRVAHLNMSQSGATCPTGLIKRQYNNMAMCGRTFYSSPGSCNSATFPTLGLTYTKVCGRIRGYQFGSPDGFIKLTHNGATSIDTFYVDGVSITHGKNPRHHIWTYACGLLEEWNDSLWLGGGCPCNTGVNSLNTNTTFIKNHYYCESGIDPGIHWEPFRFHDDPLWDGKQCDSNEVPCCTNSKMPWFYRSLNSKGTHDDIELRLCGDQHQYDEDTPLDIIELFIK